MFLLPKPSSKGKIGVFSKENQGFPYFNSWGDGFTWWDNSRMKRRIY
jgi:hypothetical protein